MVNKVEKKGRWSDEIGRGRHRWRLHGRRKSRRSILAPFWIVEKMRGETSGEIDENDDETQRRRKRVSKPKRTGKSSQTTP